MASNAPSREELGPGYWSVYHRLALDATDAPGIRRFLDFEEWLKKKFPCPTCRTHFVRILMMMPVHPEQWIANNSDVSSAFAHSVAAHNAVNTDLGKPTLTVSEARAIHSTDCVEGCPRLSSTGTYSTSQPSRTLQPMVNASPSWFNIFTLPT